MAGAGQGRRSGLWTSSVAVVAAMVVGTLGSLAVGPPAGAAPGPGYGFGYVWANSPSIPVGTIYTPSLSYQTNSTGALNTATRTATGVYEVRFPNLGSYGTALVTAYGADTNRCKVGGWAPAAGASGSDTVLTVLCHTVTGVPVNTMFTASYTYPGPGVSRAAYLRSDIASPPIPLVVTPSPAYQYNSEGGLNTVRRLATGLYDVRLPGLGTSGAPPFLPIAAAYGSAAPDPSTYCGIYGSIPRATEGVYEVGCFNAAGTFVDSQFVMTYVESGNHLLAPTASHPTAHAQIFCLTPLETSCGFSQPYDTNPDADIRAAVGTPGSGLFLLPLPMPLTGGNVQVGLLLADRPMDARCKVTGWATGGVGVMCFDATGAVITNGNAGLAFSVSFVR